MTPLSDAALQDFIIQGYRVVHPTATAELHGELHRQVERVLAAGNPGNGLIDRIPLLHQFVRRSGNRCGLDRHSGAWVRPLPPLPLPRSRAGQSSSELAQGLSLRRQCALPPPALHPDAVLPARGNAGYGGLRRWYPGRSTIWMISTLRSKDCP